MLQDKNLADDDIIYIPLLAVVTKRVQFILNEVVNDEEDVPIKNLADLDEILSTLFVLDEEALRTTAVLSFLEMVISPKFLRPKV